MSNLNILIDKNEPMPIGQGALYSIVSILMVFTILLIIIGVTTLIFKINGLFDLKKELDKAKNKNTSPTTNSVSEVEIKDDDMMAAMLVATIDYRNEIKKDVKVISIKEIK